MHLGLECSVAYITRADKDIGQECAKVLASGQGAKEPLLAGETTPAEAAGAGQETASKEGRQMRYPPLTHQAAAATTGKSPSICSLLSGSLLRATVPPHG
ncbi:MAG: hypothetical protein JOZ19_16715 [Rubrobacter sp.]|nr:hypothetical protein [Rubrobacter sp.]